MVAAMVVVAISVVVEVATGAMVVHPRPIHPIIGHIGHPVLCPHHLDLCPILCLGHPMARLDLYLHPSLSASLVEVYLLNLYVKEGVQTMHHM